MIQAETAEVLGVTMKGVMRDDLSVTEITLERALEIAQSQQPDGFIIEAQMDLESEAPGFEMVLYLSDSEELWRATIDANTGVVENAEVVGTDTL